MASGALWMVFFKLLDKSISLLSTVLLARLLLPTDFGVVAMATSFIVMLEALSAFGFDTALIQRQSTSPAHFDTAWTFNVVMGLSIGTLMLALSIPISRFYGVASLVPVICTLAFASAVQGFENIGVVMFRKELNFAREFRYLLGKRIVVFLVTVPLAIALRSYWALVIGTVAGRINGVALSYLMQSYRPRFSLAARADLFHFSKWMLLFNALGFLKERSSDFVVGRLAGAHALGIFNVSSDLANMPGTELVAPINRAVFPAYARLAHDLDALRAEYLSVMSMVGLLGHPGGGGCGSHGKTHRTRCVGPELGRCAGRAHPAGLLWHHPGRSEQRVCRLSRIGPSGHSGASQRAARRRAAHHADHADDVERDHGCGRRLPGHGEHHGAGHLCLPVPDDGPQVPAVCTRGVATPGGRRRYVCGGARIRRRPVAAGHVHAATGTRA